MGLGLDGIPFQATRKGIFLCCPVSAPTSLWPPVEWAVGDQGTERQLVIRGDKGTVWEQGGSWVTGETGEQLGNRVNRGAVGEQGT